MMIVAALIAVNLATIAAFRIDKRRAVAGEWRIAESTLLWLAAIGGSPGALWARWRFRHKTRKQPFATRLDLIAMTHAGVATGLAVAVGIGSERLPAGAVAERTPWRRGSLASSALPTQTPRSTGGARSEWPREK